MLASVVDSCLDLLNGLVLFLTRRSIDTKQYYEYPQVRAYAFVRIHIVVGAVYGSLACRGVWINHWLPIQPTQHGREKQTQGKKRLEPVGVLIFATAMVR